MLTRALIRRFWKPLLAVLCTCALGIAVMVGMSGGCLSLERSTEDYLRACRYYDASITTEVTARDLVDAAAQVEGVAHAEARLVANTLMVGPSGRILSIRAMTYGPDDWQRFVVWDSARTGDADAVMLEYEFALDNGIQAGDDVRVRVDGSYRTCRVGALVTAPETLSVRGLDDQSPPNSDFGVVYVPVSLLAREAGLARADAGAQLWQRESELGDAQAEAARAYDQALDDLRRAQSAWQRRLDEADEALASMADPQAELDGREQVARRRLVELEEREAELEATREQAESLRDELGDAYAQADATQGGLEARRAEVVGSIEALKNTIADLSARIAALEQAQQALVDIDAATAELDELAATLGSEDVQRLMRILGELDAGIDLSALQFDANELDESLGRYAEQLFALDETGLLASATSSVLSQVGVLDDAVAASTYLAGSVPGLLASIDGYADTLRALVDGDGSPTTAGRLLDAYAQLAASIEPSLAELGLARAGVESELAAAGVDEASLPGALAQMRTERSEAQDSLAEHEAELVGIDAELEQSRANLQRLTDDLARAQDGLARAEAGVGELEGLRQEALDALTSIGEARSELDDLQAQAQDGQASLGELGAQLERQRMDAEEQWQQGLVDFSGVRDELERARAELGTQEGYDAFHNQLLLWVEEGADRGRTLEAVCAALDPIEVKSSFSYKDSPVKARLDNNVVPLRALSYYLPAVFFGIVLMVTFLFMALMVRQSRVTIGILRALGKSAGQVRGLFCGLGLLVSVAAIVPGLALAWGVISYMAGYYLDFFKLPEVVRQLDLAVAGWALALTVATVQVATLVGTTLVASIQPSEALSRPAPSSARVPRVLRWLTAGLDELSKFGVLSVLRNPLRVGFSVVCIAATVAIILASQSFIASKNQLVHQEFDQRIAYDCQVFFSGEPDDETLAQIEGLGIVRDLERMGFFSCTIASGGVERDANVNALAPGTDLVGIYDAGGTKLNVPDDGIVLDDHLAGELGVGVGDTVEVRGVPLRVQALSRQDTSRVQYVSLQKMPALGKSALGCVVCRIRKADQQRLMEALGERDDFVLAVFTDVVRASMERLYATYDLSVWILTSFAVAIGALVVFNVLQANLIERKRELCVLRTLGFEHGRLSRALFWQTMLYVGLACAAGFPVGRMVALRALAMISTPDRTFAYANGLREYAATVAIVLVYASVSHLLAMRSMRAWDINEGVKDKE